MSLLLISALVSSVGAVLSLLLSRAEVAAKNVACVFGVVAAICAIGAGAGAISTGGELVYYDTPLSFANFSLLLNPLSGLMLLIINILALTAWIYGISYFNEYKGKGLGTIGFFMNIFIAAMNFVVTVDNAFWFLVFFELMSLTSYFLVIVDRTNEAYRGGLLYFIMAHVGFLLIMVSFFVMGSLTGSLEFDTYRHTVFSPGIASLVFLLAFVGFGCKAGMIPVFSWLPQAHPAAPSNVSALMSGGMIKIGIFGMIKVGFDMLGISGQQAWWGFIVIIIGALSAVLGVTYAIRENDVKRMLAYSSMENIGIILLGFGVALVGAGMGQPVLAVAAMLAALYHMLNHGMFKGLLFMGAGSLLYSTGTRDMRLMGGLAKAMPVTGACFLIGAVAISALPPLNGFVSEWYTYQAMFGVGALGTPLIKFFMALGAVSLAITGALAAVCFVCAYGVPFTGKARSEAAANAKEVPVPMLVSLVVLAAACIILGIGSPWITPVMSDIASTVVTGPALVTSTGVAQWGLMNTYVSMPLLLVTIAIGVIFGLIIKTWNSKATVATDREPWACGYNYISSEMSMSANMFASETDTFMHGLYQMRTGVVDWGTRMADTFKAAFARPGDQPDNLAGQANPFAAFSGWIGRLASKLESGNFRRYIVYIVVALVVLLILLVLVQMGGGAR